MEWLRITINVVLAVCAVVLIGVVLMQDAKGGGMTAITGQTGESFFGKNKGKSREGRLQRLTQIFMAVIAVLSITLALLSKNIV